MHVDMNKFPLSCITPRNHAYHTNNTSFNPRKVPLENWEFPPSYQSLPNKHNLELMMSLLFSGASASGWRRHEVQVVPTLRATSIWMNCIYSISLFQQPSLTWILGRNCRRGCPSSCENPSQNRHVRNVHHRKISTFNPGTARVSGPTPKSFASHWRLKFGPKLWTLKGLP